MKTTSTKYISLALILLIFAFSGCFSPWKGDEAKITLYLTGSPAAARAVEQGTLSELSHTVLLSGPTGKIMLNAAMGETELATTVSPGRWDIEVEAFWGEIPFARGKAMGVNLIAGHNTPILIIMLLLEEDKESEEGTYVLLNFNFDNSALDNFQNGMDRLSYFATLLDARYLYEDITGPLNLDFKPADLAGQEYKFYRFSETDIKHLPAESGIWWLLVSVYQDLPQDIDAESLLRENPDYEPLAFTCEKVTIEPGENRFDTTLYSTHSSKEKNRITKVGEVLPYLNDQPDGQGAVNPVFLSVELDLGNMTQATSNWHLLLEAIDAARKYVTLDLSECTMPELQFNPDNTIVTGKGIIANLILPDKAESISAGNPNAPAFDNFSELFGVVGNNIQIISSYAFSRCTNLQSVKFPAATVVEEYAFSYCTNLAIIDLPRVTTISNNTFEGCINLTSLTLRSLTNINSYAFKDTGNNPLSIELGYTAPVMGIDIFSGISGAKIITISIPSDADISYGVSGSETTIIEGTDDTETWGNGLRGRGWTGSGHIETTSSRNNDITVIITRES